MDLFKLNKPTNRLLAALPKVDYQRLFPHLEAVKLSQHKILYKAGESCQYAYFPNCAIVFSMAIMDNGSTTEIGVIGNEGMVGLPIILGSSYKNSTAIVRVEGSGFRIAAEHLQSELNRQGALQTILMRYVQTRIIQLGQTVVCNQYHNLEQRFASWLLTVRDNLQQNEFQLTDESISQMLGVCHTQSMEIIEEIQGQGIIDVCQGKIRIIDCQALENIACECYEVVKKWYQV